jgi:hypothetical protein
MRERGGVGKMIATLLDLQTSPTRTALDVRPTDAHTGDGRHQCPRPPLPKLVTRALSNMRNVPDPAACPVFVTPRPASTLSKIRRRQKGHWGHISTMDY